MLASALAIVDSAKSIPFISAAWADDDMGEGEGMYDGGVATGFNAVDTGSAYNGVIGTKLAGTQFSLDILALMAKNTSVCSASGAFTGTVTVQLLNASDNSGVLNKVTGCRSSWTGIGSATGVNFNSQDRGRQSKSFKVNNAYRAVKVRMDYDYKYNGYTYHLISCSSDNFAIRPTDFVVSSNMTNATASGTPAAPVGTSFMLTADAISGYDGTPKIDIGKVQAHAGAAMTGQLTGSFGPASATNGRAAGSNFKYGEVGNFRFLAEGVYDDNFTAVDQGKSPSQCVKGSSLNSGSGTVGCNIGNQNDKRYFGRFYPDHFAVSVGPLVNRNDVNGGSNSTFTYMGEKIGLTLTIFPQSDTNGALYNYFGNYATLSLTNPSMFNFGARDTATGIDLSARLSVALPSTDVWSTTFAQAVVHPTLTINRNATPDGPYTAVKLGIKPVDLDGVTLLPMATLAAQTPPIPVLDVDGNGTLDHQQVGAGTEIRFGRLVLSSVYGPQMNALPMPVKIEYWCNNCAATPGFVTNTADSLTQLSTGRIDLGKKTGGLGSYTGPLDFIEAGKKVATVTITKGVENVLLSPLTPVSAAGSVKVTYTLGSGGSGGTGTDQTFLQTNNQDPSATATFGIYRSQLIYMRENF